MKSARLILRTVLVAWCTIRSANACSMTSCLNHGFEPRSSFRVTVKHGKLPLSRAVVYVSGMGKDFTVFTDAKGRVMVQNLSAGDYWIDVEFLAVSAPLVSTWLGVPHTRLS